MKAMHDQFGDVRIEFNSQCEEILSPDGKLKLLPCDKCGHLEWVQLNVVSKCCQPCWDMLNECVPEMGTQQLKQLIRTFPVQNRWGWKIISGDGKETELYRDSVTYGSEHEAYIMAYSFRLTAYEY